MKAVIGSLLAALAVSQRAGGGVGPEWPQFHGPRRDNKSEETGFLKRWPRGGPRLLWTARGIGKGFSTVAVANGLIYTTGNVGRDTAITALGLDGTVRWTATNGPACRHEHPGTRGTPTVDGDRLYHENADGDVVCLDARTGKRIWSLNILKRFNGRNVRWGLAESLLVDGDRLVCTPGGAEAGIVALDKNTGRTVWVCRETGDKPGYASPVVVDYGGLRQIVTMMARSVVGVHAETGELLWRHGHRAYWDENILTPVCHDRFVFVSTLRPSCSQLLKLHIVGNRASAEQAWQTDALDNHHGGVVLVEGYLYGSTTGGRWVCLELETGRLTHTARGVGKGSLTCAEGMLYTYSERRTAGLVRAAPEGHELVSSFRIPEGGQGPSWAHPVVCGGRLYLRHGDYLYCYDIRERAGQP